ncbi:MAG: pyruvate dehydrogenase complex dihydrolipoamide acetyltransferase [Pseudomonadota bacterium]
MPIAILMPALSPTMEEGTLAKWHVKEGDTVEPGDVIAEIETDKATMEVEAVDEGKVAKILINEGTAGVAVNETIAVLLEDGEDNADIDIAASSKQGGSSSSPAENAPKVNGSNGSNGIIIEHEPLQPQQNGNGAGRVFASPLAKRLAKNNAIDLSLLKGSGPNGRIVKLDIEKAIKEGVPSQAASGAGKSLVSSPGTSAARPMSSGMSDEQVLALYEPDSYDIVPLDNMRKIIATRLVESKQSIPHFYLTIDCELDALLAARKRMNEASPKEGPNFYKLSVNDFIIKALAMALQQAPEANATWTEGGILRHKRSDVGVAVAIEGGLFTPVVRHADLKTLSEISNEMKDLAGRARKKRLAPHEYQGGTTSISNLGMFGIKRFDAVINPPHATILSIGAGEKRPVIKGDDVKVATVMSVTLSCDHRVVDGALGAELLQAFKVFIEEPVTMLV